MTTDIAVLERALVVMAVCMAVQTLLCVGAGIGALIAWRRAAEGIAEAKAAANTQLAELREQLHRMSATVDDAAGAVRRGSVAVDGMLTDVRDAVGTVRHSVGSVASAVTAPRTAVALGVLRGIQLWRRRRAAQRLAPTTDSRGQRHSKGEGNGTVERSGLSR